MQCDLVWTHWLVFLVTTNYEHVIKYLHEFPKKSILIYPCVEAHFSQVEQTLQPWKQQKPYSTSWLQFQTNLMDKFCWMQQCAHIPLGLDEGDYFTMFSTYLLWFSWVHVSLLILSFGWQVSSSHCFFSLLIIQCSYAHLQWNTY
jgi:hypothetical protein